VRRLETCAADGAGAKAAWWSVCTLEKGPKVSEDPAPISPRREAHEIAIEA